jgi:hypothetical protein
VAITRASLERLRAARLYVLVDGCGSPEELARLVGALVQAGVHVVQLRDKRLADRELLARARLVAGPGLSGVVVGADLSSRPVVANLLASWPASPGSEAGRCAGAGGVAGASSGTKGTCIVTACPACTKIPRPAGKSLRLTRPNGILKIASPS